MTVPIELKRRLNWCDFAASETEDLKEFGIRTSHWEVKISLKEPSYLWSLVVLHVNQSSTPENRQWAKNQLQWMVTCWRWKCRYQTPLFLPNRMWWSEEHFWLVISFLVADSCWPSTRRKLRPGQNHDDQSNWWLQDNGESPMVISFISRVVWGILSNVYYTRRVWQPNILMNTWQWS